MKRTCLTFISFVVLVGASGCSPQQQPVEHPEHVSEPQQGHGHGHHGHGHGHHGPGHHGDGHRPCGHSCSSSHPHKGHFCHKMCPMKIPGTRLSISDVEGGAALLFTTSADQVSFLQARVKARAFKFNCNCGRKGPRSGPSCGCKHGKGHHVEAPGHEKRPHGSCGKGRGIKGKAFAVAEMTPEGARLVFLATSAEYIEPIRAFIREKAERINQKSGGSETQPESAPLD